MNESTKFTNKDLHCLARKIQRELLDVEMDCLYCKYAVECSKDFKEKHLYHREIVMEKVTKLLQEKTDVFVQPWLNKKICSKKLLDGSWIQLRPELMEKFVGKSFEEQMSLLQSSEILEYTEKLERG